jgi:hypothetical protein
MSEEPTGNMYEKYLVVHKLQACNLIRKAHPVGFLIRDNIRYARRQLLPLRGMERRRPGFAFPHGECVGRGRRGKRLCFEEYPHQVIGIGDVGGRVNFRGQSHRPIFIIERNAPNYGN